MIRVIILEPDPMVTRILKETVAVVKDFQVAACVRNLKQLSQQVEEHHPQLILGEVHLEDGSLEDWLSHDLQKHMAVDVFPVTGDNRAATYLRFRHSGLVDYVLKPFTKERLVEGLRRYLQFRRTLAPEKTVTQEQIDHLTGTVSSAEETFFRGNDRTWKRVRSFIDHQQGEAFTLTQMMEQTGLSRSTGRRYLSELVESGQLEILLDYGRIGRPQHQFRAM